jgi:hypothetical protein
MLVGCLSCHAVQLQRVLKIENKGFSNVVFCDIYKKVVVSGNVFE